MRTPTVVLALLAALVAGGCGPKPKDPSPKGGPDGPVADDQEFALGREWVQTMLEEDRKALAKMRDELDAVRREVERLDATGSGDGVEAESARVRLRELLDAQDRALLKFRENAAEMRKVMGEGKP